MAKSSAAVALPRTDAMDDPVWRAAMAAPLDTTPDTEEEIAAIEAVKRSGFRSTPGASVTAELARRSRKTR